MGVLTNDYFCFSLLISLLMAKVIPAGDTIDIQGIFLLLHNVSSSSPLMLLLLPHVMSPDMPYIQQKVVIGLF
ncbi:hypothetical protein J4198_004632 [Salmonella enterica]|nr:hypothetical protein [Salmonella enterica]EHG6844863.1 hypothetical protein [Salmonella enterica]